MIHPLSAGLLSKSGRPASRRRFWLVLIALSYCVLVALYATGVPRWNAPDEPAHFNYIRYVAEKGQLPILNFGDFDAAYLDRLKAAHFPPDLPIDSIRYESHQPPLYYLAGAVIYRLSSTFDFTVQVLALRLFSGVLGLILLLIAYATVRGVFPSVAWPALGVVAFLAFLPMHLAVNGAIGNDPAADLIMAVITWESTRLVICRSEATGAAIRQRRLFSPYPRLGLWIGLALLTKTTVYGGVLVACAAILLAGRRDRVGLNRIVLRAAVAGVFALMISGWWFVRNGLIYGITDPFGLRRQYEVALAAGQPLTGPMSWDVLRHFTAVSFQSFWGQFGWMGVPMDERVYLALGVLCLAAVAGLALSFKGHELKRLSAAQSQALVLLFIGFVLVAGEMLQYSFSSFLQPQGRYMFPALVAIAAAFVLGLRSLAAGRHVSLLLVVLFGGMALLDVFALFRWIIPALSLAG